jgi:hypothetical protein
MLCSSPYEQQELKGYLIKNGGREIANRHILRQMTYQLPAWPTTCPVAETHRLRLLSVLAAHPFNAKRKITHAMTNPTMPMATV